MPGHVFLTGFMATGKSVVGRELARRTGRRFVDTDAEVERAAGTTVAEIFRTAGEPRFRELEREAIERACAGPEAVVATGGGAMLDPRNRSHMKGAGTIVCLVASPGEILRRTGSADTRPLLAGAPDPLRRIRELLAEREPAYAGADLRIETDGLSPVEIADRIDRFLGRETV